MNIKIKEKQKNNRIDINFYIEHNENKFLKVSISKEDLDLIDKIEKNDVKKDFIIKFKNDKNDTEWKYLSKEFYNIFDAINHFIINQNSNYLSVKLFLSNKKIFDNK